MEKRRGEDEEGPLGEHKRDAFAHPQHEQRLMIWWEGQMVERRRFVDQKIAEQEGRLNRHDRFIEQLRGGILVIAAMMAGGGIAFLFHLFGPR